MSGAEIAALSIAANVIQFIDFGMKLCDCISEYSKTGAPKELLARSRRLSDLLKILKELPEAQHLRLDQQAISVCARQAEDLLALLDPLTSSNGPGTPKWKAAAKAFRYLRSGKKMIEFQSTLDSLLSNLNLLLLAKTADVSSRVETNTTSIMRHQEMQSALLTDINRMNKLNSLAYCRKATGDFRDRQIWMVPFGRNSDFVGREDIFLELNKRLIPRQDCVPIAALCGLGGVGKSQIALEYAYKIKSLPLGFSVFWVYASSLERFKETYRRIASEFSIPGCEDPNEDLMQLVRNWLESKYDGMWLMVIDNVDDANMFFKLKNSFGKSLLEYVPQSPKGSILYTTRDTRVGMRLVPRWDPVVVPPMNSIEGCRLIREKVKGKSAESEELELLKELDYLPLAISQAAAFMAERRQTIPQYLAQYRSSVSTQTKLLKFEFIDHGRESRALDSVATTFMISLNFILKQNPMASSVLSLMSLLDRQGIPKSLILRDEDPLDLDDAIGMLESFSLIATNDQRDSYKMHRLVQSVTHAWLNEYGEGAENQASLALHLLAAKFPTGKFENWLACEAYLPHAENVLRYPLEYSSQENAIARAALLLNTSSYLKSQGRLNDAKARANESFYLYERILGSEHIATLSSASNLAQALKDCNMYEEAEEMCRRALQGRERVLGREHPHTLASISDLASVLQEQGNYGAAEKLNRRALEGREKVLGREHAETLESVQSQATLLGFQGKYSAAEKMSRRALEGRQKLLGTDHPDTLLSVSLLASALVNQGKYEEAVRLRRRTLEGRRKLLGMEHPITLSSATDVAWVLLDQEKHREAEEIMRPTLEAMERVLGKEHLYTLAGVNCLGWILLWKGMYGLSVETFQRGLEASEKALGEEHRYTLFFISNLASALCDQGKYQAAEAMNQRALDRREKLFGRDHLLTQISVSKLALALQKQLKYEAAEDLYRENLVCSERVLGPEHPGTLDSASTLAMALQGQENYKDAEDLYRRVLDGRERVLGPEHPETLCGIVSLASVLQDQRKYKDAEKLYRRALGSREMVLGSEHPRTLNSIKCLALVLQNLGMLKDAEELNKRALDGRERTLGPDHPDTVSSVMSLISVLRDQRKYKEAEQLSRRALGSRERALGLDHPDALSSVCWLSHVLNDQRK